ncbi:MAG: diaminopropionate ammonia-lyase [Spirochaetaceae bacterium]|jgi:diaminopropionate ammonia-lyase|nr:diaminopropionate ammonia-lyase [Spirochaetaceae bacterium]GMO23959.1 MAG: diaminopropionate ammonia-lyase [Termitinemataceae bacterium]
MKDKIKWVKNVMPKTDCAGSMALMTVAEMQKAHKFHSSFPQYKETPLVKLDALARQLGLGGLYLKDESWRFGLNAFKVLGGSYAIARYIAQKTGRDIGEFDYKTLISDELKKKLGDITFYTATDGNHGRGVAWAANKLRQKSVVLMPAGSSATRLENIRKEGADASITDLNYDDAVRLANEKASKDPNGVMVQDTAWEGYEEIPAWIMQGYGTMSFESYNQLKEYGIERPTHIFVQAGVGSLAGSVQGFFSNAYKENPPVVTVVEAQAADCIYRSAKEQKLVAVGGSLSTIMAGLACGEANTISWQILKNHTGFFVSAPDWVAAKGMRTLAAPLRGDSRVISGESGAVPAGLVAAIMENDDYKELREALALNEKSRVLVFSTEGDTDPQRYKSVVWDGEYPSI